MSDWSTKTVAEARVHVQMHTLKGVTCPCCQRVLKARVRSLNSNMASSLVRLYYLSVVKAEGWVHTPSRKVDPQREMAKLAFWELIESQVNTDTRKRCSGVWRPTKTGIDFVLGKVVMPAKIILAKNTFIGCSDGNHALLPKQYISIQEALANHFDYAKLMAGQG